MEPSLLEFEGGSLLPSFSVAVRYPVHRADSGIDAFCAIDSIFNS